MDEIKSIVNVLNPWKALGSDGLNGQFYKSCWDIISNDVVDMVQGLFNGRHSLHEINKTLIIPKHTSAQNVSYFRPIRLCNKIYKIFQNSWPTESKLFYTNASVMSRQLSSKLSRQLIILSLQMNV